MGLAERDYTRRASRPSGLSAAREWSATTWLIVTFVAVFFLDAMITPPWPMAMGSLGEDADISSASLTMLMYSPIARWTHFSLTTAIERRQVWRIVTFPLAHLGVWSIAVNVTCLWFIGREFERVIGAARLLLLFALASLAAPATYATAHFSQVIIGEPWVALAGATAGVLGIVIAAACTGPNDDVALWTSGAFLPRRTLAWIAAAIAAVVAIKQDPTGAGAAHLGGAVMGLLLAWPIVPRGMRRASD
jgi:membrane associated rhomboid family serine protease